MQKALIYLLNAVGVCCGQHEYLRDMLEFITDFSSLVLLAVGGSWRSNVTEVSWRAAQEHFLSAGNESADIELRQDTHAQSQVLWATWSIDKEGMKGITVIQHHLMSLQIEWRCKVWSIKYCKVLNSYAHSSSLLQPGSTLEVLYCIVS